jgi:protein-tyrosine phosphatase
MPFGPFSQGQTWEEIKTGEIDLVFMLLEKQEYLVYTGRDLPEYYRSAGLEVVHEAVPDFGIPENQESWNKALHYAVDALADGRNILVHCLAGLGRTGTFLACLATDLTDRNAYEAVQWIRELIPGAVQTDEQVLFVQQYEITKNTKQQDS